jgi:hypothetical protein
VLVALTAAAGIFQFSEPRGGSVRSCTGSWSVNVMRNLAMAVGKRLQAAQEEVAEELPDDIEHALVRLQGLRWRPSWHHGRYPPPARRRAKPERALRATEHGRSLLRRLPE